MHITFHCGMCATLCHEKPMADLVLVCISVGKCEPILCKSGHVEP